MKRTAVGAPGRSFDRPAEGERGFWPGAATGTERRLNTGRYESGRDWTAYGARSTAPSPEHRADAGKPALRRAHAVGRAMPGAGGEGKKGMSHAWRRARLRRAREIRTRSSTAAIPAKAIARRRRERPEVR